MLGEFESKLGSCLSDMDGSLVLSLRVPKAESGTTLQMVESIKQGIKSGKEQLKVSISWYREKRSQNANSYFHVLVDKIAKLLGISMDECKTQMVLRYGAIACENDEHLIVALPKSAKVNDYYPYAKWIGDFEAKNKQLYSQYIFYKQTHMLDSVEMAKLIDGVVSDAKELGIETRTPKELASLIENWEAK